MRCASIWGNGFQTKRRQSEVLRREHTACVGKKQKTSVAGVGEKTVVTCGWRENRKLDLIGSQQSKVRFEIVFPG